MSSQAQKEAQHRYDNKVKRITIKYSLHELHEYDALLEHLSHRQQSVSGYIKELIRRDLETQTCNAQQIQE